MWPSDTNGCDIRLLVLLDIYPLLTLDDVAPTIKTTECDCRILTKLVLTPGHWDDWMWRPDTVFDQRSEFSFIIYFWFVICNLLFNISLVQEFTYFVLRFVLDCTYLRGRGVDLNIQPCTSLTIEHQYKTKHSVWI